MRYAYALIIFSWFSFIPCNLYADYLSFPFIGKWQSAENPLLLDDYGLQDIQNMRRDGKRFVPIKGHTLVDEAETYYPYATDILHYTKNVPGAESHVIVDSTLSGMSDPVSHEIRGYSSSIPDGSFTLSLDSFSDTPGVTFDTLYSNLTVGPRDSLLWGTDRGVFLWNGEEDLPVVVLMSDTSASAGLSNIIDYTEEALCVSSTNGCGSITLGATNKYMMVGFAHPIQDLNIYVDTPNTSSSTMSVYMRYTGGWAALGSVSDGTSSGGISLAQSGTVELGGSPHPAQCYQFYLEGYSLYWYEIYVSAGTAAIEYITGYYSKDFMTLTPVWSGETIPISYFGVCTGSGATACDAEYLEDNTLYLQDEDQTTYATLNTTAASSFIVGSPVLLQGLKIYMVEGQENDTTATGGIYGWDGDSYALLDSFTVSEPLNSTGSIAWSVYSGLYDFQTASLNGIGPMYLHKAVFSAALDADTQIYYVEGIPAPPELGHYTLPVLFSNRLFLFNNNSNSVRNSAIYSSENTYYIFDGSDSGEIYVGDSGPVIAAKPLYNVYTNTGYEQLVMAKVGSTYRLIGGDPESFSVEVISPTIGITAPRSMTVCGSYVSESGAERQVLMWQSDYGIVMCDGARVWYVSQDIKQYWDPDSDDFIPVNRQEYTYGWYTPETKSASFLISSGSGQTSHNIELEYSLDLHQWTKINRGSEALQAACQVRATNNVVYTYGADNLGYVHHLEDGDDFNSTAMAKYLWTGDLMLDKEAPFFHDTSIEWFRFIAEDETSGSATVTHYCDGVATVNGTNDQQMPDNIDLSDGPWHTTDVTLGPCHTHSFKISSSSDEFNPLGMGFVFEPYDAISE